MIGYIIELYKISDIEEAKNDENDELSEGAYVTFGDFDRMAISKTTAFSRMRDMSKLSRTWIGDRQTVLLYELSIDNEVVYKDIGEDQGFYISSGGDDEKRDEDLFIGLTILQFKNRLVEEEVGTTEYINACRKNILNVVHENTENESVHCSVFGILGSYGVAIVWTSNQYTEILKLINKIKGMDIDGSKIENGYPYLSVYTIFAKNNITYETLQEKKNLIIGKAMLRLTLRTNLNQKLLRELKYTFGDAPQFHSVGEHDMLIMTETKILYDLYENDAILDRKGRLYKQFVLQTNTKLCGEEIKVDAEKKDPQTDGADVVLQEPDRDKNRKAPSRKLNLKCEIDKHYQNLRRLFFENFPKTAGMVDSLDLLYGDYLSKTSSGSNEMWTEDFRYQFYTILEVLEKKLGEITKHKTSVKTINILEDIRDILNCFEYQIIHIAESNNLVLETPKCHLRYTGQNNLTLYAYFGIVKDILKLTYRMQGMCRQLEIVPLISVDTVPTIKSVLFMGYKDKNTKEILKLNLPMMALYNIPLYVPYLYHEIFHYVVPHDRLVRNWYKGNILTMLAMRNLFRYIIYYHLGIEDDKVIVALLKNVLLPYIYKTVMAIRYQELPAIIKDENKCALKREVINQSSVDNSGLPINVKEETWCTWTQYEKNLIKKIYEHLLNADKKILDENFVYCIFRDFYRQKDDIIRQTEKWAKCEKITLAGYGHDITKSMKEFLERLKAMVDNIARKNMEEAYQKMIASMDIPVQELIGYEELKSVSLSINEAICDVAMVELAKMDAAEYLLSYVKIQNDLLKNVDRSAQEQDVIRIGIVLDKIYGFDEMPDNNLNELNSIRGDFVDLYIGLYFSVNTFGQTDDSTHLKVLSKDAKAWFDKFVGWYQHYVVTYRIHFKMMEQIINQYSTNKRMPDNDFSHLGCKECYQAMKTYGRNIQFAMKNKVTESFEDLLTEIKEARQTFRSTTFAINVKIIQRYQKQQDFNEISNICKKYFKGDKPYEVKIEEPKIEFAEQTSRDWEGMGKRLDSEKCDYTYEVKEIDELCNAIENITAYFTNRDKELYVEKGHNFWYRGHQSTQYKLLPSAMRRFAEMVRNPKDLRKHQRASFEEFKFRMDDASETFDTSSYTACDYLALMQHYGVPTIYLDWSENAITSLYFALEAYIDPKKADEKNQEDAVLYIMHPNLYNEARNTLMEKAGQSSGRALERAIRKDTVQLGSGTLPNLSVEYNKDKYQMFLLGDIENDDDIPDSIGDIDLVEGNAALLYLPLAIYSSRANMRIRSQHGMFVAFNIFTPPDNEEKFEYISLEKIQDAYLKICKDREPFMYKIIIKNGSKQRIANWLKAIGVTKDMIYPELSHIGERI